MDMGSLVGQGASIFSSPDQIISKWKTLADAHPQWVSYESIGKSVKGKDIWLFKIGNPSSGKVMYDGVPHGGEAGGTEILYKFTKWLLESKDPKAEHILRWNYHLIIPVLNVDSVANRRQNMRENYVLSDGRVIDVPYGVDLNRNGIYGWGQSGSSDPENPYEYRGAWAGSEPETQAYHNAVGKYRPEIYIDTHNGDGEYLKHYSDTELEHNITAIKNYYEEKQGVTDPYFVFRGGVGGYISVDADGSWNASGWLWETAKWENMNSTLEDWLETYYPKAFPAILAFAESVEKKPSGDFAIISPDYSWLIYLVSIVSIVIILLASSLLIWKNRVKHKIDTSRNGAATSALEFEYRSRGK